MDGSTNNSSSSNDTSGRESTSYYVISVSANFVVFVLITVNNLLLLTTLARSRKLWTLPNAYIASLSVADLLVGVVLVFRHFWLLPSTEWLFDNHKYVCMPIICLLYVSALESQASLVLVSLDRYLYIVHPFWYERNITSRVTAVTIGITWVISTSLGALPLWLNDFTPETGCNPMTMISRNYLLYCPNSFFFLAGAVIVCMYGRILCVGNKHRRQIESVSTGAAGQTKREKFRWQVIKILMLVCGLFFICWIPLSITAIFYFTIGVPNILITITVSVAGINSALNLYVLLAMNKTFKLAFCNTICCCRRRRSKVGELNFSCVTSSHDPHNRAVGVANGGFHDDKL